MIKRLLYSILYIPVILIQILITGILLLYQLIYWIIFGKYKWDVEEFSDIINYLENKLNKILIK